MNTLLGALKSKTIWYGLGKVLLAAAAAYFHDTLLPLLQEHPQAILVLSGLGTVLLRSVTDKPLAAK
jgi:hypothetical protein